MSKLAGEHYARVFAELHGLETVSLRYFNVYGPRQRADSQYAAVVPRFIDALSPRRARRDPRRRLQSRDFTYVADAVAGQPPRRGGARRGVRGRVYNVARGEPHTVLELLGVLAELLGVERRAQPRRRAGPATSATRTPRSTPPAGDLGYRPRVAPRRAGRRRWPGGRRPTARSGRRA